MCVLPILRTAMPRTKPSISASIAASSTSGSIATRAFERRSVVYSGPCDASIPAMAPRALIERSRLHTGLLIALVLAVLLWALLKYTTLGFEIRAVGANARAAAFAGMSVGWVTVKVALLSGALAGLAGAIEVAGRAGYVTLDMSPGYGYSGIVIAMLAALNPLGVVAAAIFVAGILVGADSMSRAVTVPTYIADVIVSVALLAMLVAAMLANYRVVWMRDAR